jgi:hypothetical protein
MNKCACPPSQHVYNASAYGFAGEIKRPTRHSVPAQAAAVLGADGGRGSSRIQGFKLDGLVAIEDAHTEVGGSYDECHNIHTTYASSTLEGVNIADVFIADKVVSKLHIYTPADGGESSFTITGSHFVNLRIAGHQVDVQLAASIFHGYDTFSKVTAAYLAKKTDPWLLGHKLGELSDADQGTVEETYHALKGMSDVVKAWKKPNRTERSSYWFSAANQLKLEGLPGDSEIKVIGNMVCVPKFGVIRLAELVVHRHCRILTMFRVQMCSGLDGGCGGAGTQGGGGSTYP